MSSIRIYNGSFGRILACDWLDWIMTSYSTWILDSYWSRAHICRTGTAYVNSPKKRFLLFIIQYSGWPFHLIKHSWSILPKQNQKPKPKKTIKDADPVQYQNVTVPNTVFFPFFSLHLLPSLVFSSFFFSFLPFPKPHFSSSHFFLLFFFSKN